MGTIDTTGYPLDGVRVLDLSRALAGPYAGRILSDLGADVVKVAIPSGDISTTFGELRHGISGLYTQLNVGKRSATADLATAEGVEFVRTLAHRCDVLIENFRPGVMAARGLGFESLAADNPRLIMLSISGFGQDGPEAQRQAYAPVVHAESSLVGRQAEVDGRAPTDVALALSDGLAGLHGTIAVLAALRRRDATGVGQHIDLSMLEAMLATDENMHSVLDGTLPIWPARGTVYQVTGGPIMVAADPKHTWNRLSKVHGVVDPTPPGAALDVKVANRAAAMREWMESFTDRQSLVAALQQADLAWGDVRTPATLLDSATLQARPAWGEVDDRGGGLRRVVNLPYRFSESQCGFRAPAAHLGEHNDDVLAHWRPDDHG